MEIDYSVHYPLLPRTVEGVSVLNDNGSYDIYINSLLPASSRCAVLEHELAHIRSAHFLVDLPVSIMERQAEGEHVNVVLHPPEGKLPLFTSEAALLSWLRTVARQQHINFPF